MQSIDKWHLLSRNEAVAHLALSLPSASHCKHCPFEADMVPWFVHFGWWLQCFRWPYAGVQALGSDGRAGGCGVCHGGTTGGVGFVQARSAVCHRSMLMNQQYVLFAVF